MHGLFPSLEKVRLDDVRTFLADAGEEGVTWEAKADDDELRKRPEGQEPGRLGKNTIRKAVCGLANQIGGYLIAGARANKKMSTWELPGIVIDHDEPMLWLGQVIEGGVQPVPRYGLKTWRLDDARTVALIEVEPVAQAPCMTSQGHVYERVSGETRRVGDPAHLDALFSRGRAAREMAERRADQAAAELARALDLGDGHGAVVLGMAPIARETDDISARLFVPSFGDAAEKALRRLLPRHGSPDQLFPSMAQAAAVSQANYYAPLEPDQPFDTPLHERDVHNVWAIVGRWDGSVAAGAGFAHEVADHPSIFDEVIAPAWGQLNALVERLGGYGPTRLTIHIVGAGPRKTDGLGGNSVLLRLSETVVVRRHPTLAPATTEEIGSIQREVLRETGILSYEPEP